MGRRTTVYNSFQKPEKWEEVAAKNRRLLKDFLNYCQANDRSPATIKQYANKLSTFFIWNLENNDNKFFVDCRKRDFVNFIGYGRLELKWSSSHLAATKSCLSSLSNYVERVLDDEYPNFKNLISSLEPIHVNHIREKTVLTVEQIEEALQKLSGRGDHQLACYLSLLFSSGVRKSEALQMKLEFFTDENVVFDLMYKTPKIRTKGRGVQGKQVPRYVFKYEFDPYLQAWLKQREELGIESEYLFVTKRYGEWVPANVSTANTWAGELSELMDTDIYSHALRHAWTTKLSREKYPVEIIQKLQAWSSSDMVSIYNDMGDEEGLMDFFASKTKTE